MELRISIVVDESMLLSLLYLTVKQLGMSELEREEVREVCDL